jgi:hypothetical protein
MKLPVRAAYPARNILIATALLLCADVPASAQSATCPAIPGAANTTEIGGFSNMRSTDGHAYGYSVMLWRAGDCLFGLFESSQGLEGDTPIGLLQDVTYDSKTGRLAFSAKLTMGVVSFQGSKGLESSRDLFAFLGNLSAHAVTGVLTHTLQDNSHSTATAIRIVLQTSRTDAESMKGSATYGDWLRKWQPILQRRGPKW